MKGAYVLLVLLLATPLEAQERSSSLKWPMMVFVSGAATDTIVTGIGATHGSIERNKALTIAGESATAIMLTATAFDVVGLWAAKRFDAKHHRLVVFLLYAGGGYRMAFGVHNAVVMR